MLFAADDERGSDVNAVLIQTSQSLRGLLKQAFVAC